MHYIADCGFVFVYFQEQIVIYSLLLVKWWFVLQYFIVPSYGYWHHGDLIFYTHCQYYIEYPEVYKVTLKNLRLT